MFKIKFYIHSTPSYRFIILVFLMLILLGCSTKNRQHSDQEDNWKNRKYPKIKIDLEEINSRGKLVAITSYSSTSYFIYRGKAMGYEYDLLNELADHLNLDLEIKIANDMNQIIDMLLKGEGDLISYGLTVTRERQKRITFTDFHTKTHQVLVQRKPANWRQMKRHNIEEILTRDPLELIGKTVHVRKESAYFERLQNLMDEIGGEINIEFVAGDVETEELIRMVAENEIDYTIADNNIAAINATYYDNIDVKTSVSFNQRIAWAVRNSSPELLDAINDWISKMRQGSDYYVIYNKYFKNRKDFKLRKGSEYFSLSGGKISKYDNFIKEGARQLNWDWRLLAALIYQESRFKPNAKSWAGAVGLMQIMPITADHVDASKFRKPEDNIKTGVKYLLELQERFKEIPDSIEKIKFVLAAYNAGPNHIDDARRLAEKYGEDENVWTDQVDNWILKKSKKKYYTDEVVKYGYCRGSEPYDYVNEIFDRYAQYKLLIN